MNYVTPSKTTSMYSIRSLHSNLMPIKKAIDTIELQGGTKNAISNDECLVSIWESLEAWGMNSRRAKLVDETTFINQFHRHQDLIASFENTVIENINSGTIDRLWETMEELSLAENRSQIVTGSKALHHLLPHLVPLIDREPDTHDHSFLINIRNSRTTNQSLSS